MTENMLEKLNDKIEVLTRFAGDKVEPLFFKWDGRTYKIEKVNLVYKERVGGDRIYYFSVSDDVNYFKLAFFTKDLKWRLMEMFYE